MRDHDSGEQQGDGVSRSAWDAAQELLSGSSEVFLRMAAFGGQQLFWVDGATALVPGGQNGPYFDLESPIRNSAHWLVTMSIAHRLTGSRDFARAGDGLVNYLVYGGPRHNGTPIHRQRFPKDWTNGVIGPAWVSEGLALAGRFLSNERARDAGSELLRDLAFDEDRGLWRVADHLSGSSNIDQTVNHQLFCTAIAADFPDDAELVRRVDRFLELAIPAIVRTKSNGVLEHHVPRTLRERAISSAVGSVRGRLAGALPRTALGLGVVSDREQRDVGYHIFSLYAACRLVVARPDAGPQLVPMLRDAARAVDEITRQPGYLTNPYSYAYNPVGFELALASRTPGLSSLIPEETTTRVLAAQLERTLEPSTGLLTRGTVDPIVLSARGYESGLLHV